MAPVSRVRSSHHSNKQTLKQNGICHMRSAPFHPSSNGLAERAVQPLRKGWKRWKERLCKPHCPGSCSAIVSNLMQWQACHLWSCWCHRGFNLLWTELCLMWAWKCRKNNWSRTMYMTKTGNWEVLPQGTMFLSETTHMDLNGSRRSFRALWVLCLTLSTLGVVKIWRDMWIKWELDWQQQYRIWSLTTTCSGFQTMIQVGPLPADLSGSPSGDPPTACSRNQGLPRFTWCTSGA